MPRKARTVLKQADPESVAILELSYLQFMEDVRPPAQLSCVLTAAQKHRNVASISVVVCLAIARL